MSKLLLLSLLVFSVSCLPVEEKGDDEGGIKTWEPITNIEDNERVHKICESLRAKESVLNVLVSSAKQYTFSYAQRNCDQEKWPEAKLVPTVITESNSTFSFSPKNGEAFGFKNVETSANGVMKAICEFGGTLQSPIRTNGGSSVGVWWTTFTSSKNCEPGFGNLCIHLQTGTTKDGTSYQIHTEEWIKFKVLDENEGFFLERKLVSSAGCKKGQSMEMKAVLK
jgi:hypothetical protein